MELFLEECPLPHLKSDSDSSDRGRVLQSLCEENHTLRPMIDVRRTGTTKEKNKDCIIWNGLLEFERLRDEHSSDDVEEVKIIKSSSCLYFKYYSI